MLPVMLIALARHWGETSTTGLVWPDFTRIAASLGLFNAGRCRSHIAGHEAWFHLPGPRARCAESWRVARSPAGLPVLLAGWIDNARALAAELKLDPAAAARPDLLYGAAFDAWGEAADRRIHGRYAAIITLPDGTLRLSRSPWNGMPLFYAADARGAVVASLPRPIHAAGWPQRLRPQAMAHLLAYRLEDDEATPFEGVRQVPSGCVVHIAPDGARITRWYDPAALAPVRLARDADYVEAARALLDEAARAALDGVERPGVLLSGGLDSPLVADALARHLPGAAPLRSYTFHPLDDWQGRPPPTLFADDRPHVRAFLACQPRIQPRFIDNAGVGFDHRSRDFFLATGIAWPGMVSGTVYHGCARAAADDGCDWLFSADFGNLTFSTSAPWAWAELLRRGQWRELARLAAARPGDQRPVWRRIAALSVMPHLPLPLRRAIRRRIHGSLDHEGPANTLLRPDGPAAALAAFDPADGMTSAGEEVTTRAQYLRETHRVCGMGAELGLGYEQVFGLRLRDVAAYRPLIEFCATIPTGQFVRGGMNRWLARRMGQGRLPEAQRLEPRMGMHNTDWHLRLTTDRASLRHRVAALADHPNIGPSLDVPRALALLDALPADETALDDLTAHALRFDIPAAVLLADYADFVSGRNARG